MKNRYSVTRSPEEPTASNVEDDTGTDLSAGSRRLKDMVAKYWWTCYAGAQNDGKGCGFWKVMDVKAEGRGPFVCDRDSEGTPAQSS